MNFEARRTVPLAMSAEEDYFVRRVITGASVQFAQFGGEIGPARI
jgi:hypothetical protein